MPEPAAQDETLDVLCSDSLRLVQKRRGYRFSLDAILLANFVTLKAREAVLDIGTGCGVILFYLCARGHRNPMVGIEIQEALHLTAEKNRRLNGCGNVTLIRADVRESIDLLRSYRFRVIISNPPFRALGAGRTSPATSRFLARCEATLDLANLLHIASSLLDAKGRLYTIYPSQRLARVVAAAAARGLELKRLRLVHPRQDEPSNLFMAEFVKDAGPGTTVDRPLCIYADGRYADEVTTYYHPSGGFHGKSPQTH
jgi:tRNA1Val (adenine37-N6)-methyltransferase